MVNDKYITWLPKTVTLFPEPESVPCTFVTGLAQADLFGTHVWSFSSRVPGRSCFMEEVESNKYEEVYRTKPPQAVCVYGWKRQQM